MMIETTINKKWKLLLPEHRAVRPEWPEWEQERLAAMHDAITKLKHPVVFDIGAEEGDFPALFCLWGADVVLFEPNPLVWPNIRAIFEGNNFKPVGYFVGFANSHTIEKPEQIENVIDQPDRDGWPECAYGDLIGNHGFRNVSEREHDTPSITIDDYVAKTGLVPDVITIDIEGAEFLALQGAEKTLADNAVKVFVSIHPEVMFQQYGTYMYDLMGFMKGLGYSHKYLAYDHELHYEFTKQ